MLEILVAISAMVSAISTALYIRYAHLTIKESQRVRAEEFRPVVSFTVGRDLDGDDRDEIHLKVTNTGLRSAYDIKVKLYDPLPLDLIDESANDLAHFIGLFNYPIGSLAPGSSLTAKVWSLDERTGRDHPELAVTRFIKSYTGPISGYVTYKDQAGRDFIDQIRIDVRSLENMKFVIHSKTDHFSLHDVFNGDLS